MNHLMEVCGATSPWRLIVESTGAPVPALSPFETPYLIVGHAQTADICLQHKDVSERHAFLLWVAGRLQVVDLGSQTGVLYEGRRQRVGWLSPGQSVRIGPYRITLPDGEAPPATDLPATIPALELDIKLRGIRAVTARAEGALAVLGSATDCEVRLLDPAVTNYHCAIVNSAQGSWIIDLLGAGGIAVNGESTRSALLSEGDTVLVGRSTVRIATIEWPEHSEDAAPPSPAERAPATPAAGPFHRSEAEPEIAPTWPSSSVDEVDSVPLLAEAAPAVVHHLAQEQVPTRVSHLDPTSTVELTDTSAPEPEPAPEPRRTGFFGSWRRAPVAVPHRAPGPPIATPKTMDELAPVTSRYDEPQPVVPASYLEPMPPASTWQEPPAPASCWEDPAAARSGFSAPSNPSFEASFSDSPDGAERRGSCRYNIAGRMAQISWWETLGPEGNGRSGAQLADASDANANGSGAAQNRTLNVSMVDVSQAGLAVLSPGVPPRGERVWFRLDDGLALDWVELVAVGSSAAGNGFQLVRFAFREACPYDLFKALVFTAGSSRT